jgi:AAA family ATP:ADP antiporter
MYILPCIALGSYGLLIFMPVLGIVRIAKIMENSTDYSIQNTARHALFLPTSREAKYKAKAAIDTFFWRMGDVFQALIVFVGVQLAFEIRHFAMVNVVLVVIWLCIVVAINREHRKISQETPEPLAKAA